MNPTENPTVRTPEGAIYLADKVRNQVCSAPDLVSAIEPYLDTPLTFVTSPTSFANYALRQIINPNVNQNTRLQYIDQFVKSQLDCTTYPRGINAHTIDTYYLNKLYPPPPSVVEQPQAPPAASVETSPTKPQESPAKPDQPSTSREPTAAERELEMAPPPPTGAQTGSGGTEGRDKRPSSGENRQAKASRTNNQPVLPGTGSAEAISGPVEIPRPFVMNTEGEVHFRKVHKFISYGLAPNPIEFDIAAAPSNAMNTYCLMTPLMEIPWNRWFMYINPSEYTVLPEGTFCKSLSIKVYYRNCTERYPTNASESSIASLNNTKDIIAAKALNISTDGLNFSYTGVDKVEPMKVTGAGVTQESKYKDLLEMMYGSSPTLTTITYPALSDLGYPLDFNSYFTLILTKQHPSTPGYEQIAPHLKVFDGNVSVGKLIFSETYNPQIAFLKRPIKTVGIPYPSVTDQHAARTTWTFAQEVPTATKTCDIGSRKFSYILDPQNQFYMSSTSHVTGTGSLAVKDANLYDLIEQSQTIFNVLTPDNSGTVQPSLHCGIRPCVKRNPNMNISKSVSYVDISAEFDIVCEMTLGYGFHTRYPHCNVNNLPLEYTYMLNSKQPIVTNKSTVFGLYQQ